jgi:hypothetical protein
MESHEDRKGHLKIMSFLFKYRQKLTIEVGMLNTEQPLGFEGGIDVLVGIINMVGERVRCRALSVTEIASKYLWG